MAKKYLSTIWHLITTWNSDQLELAQWLMNTAWWKRWKWYRTGSIFTCCLAAGLSVKVFVFV